MRDAPRTFSLLALLLIPFLTAGGQAIPGRGPDGAPMSPGGPGPCDRSLPPFLNISFAGKIPSAQDWYEQGFAFTKEERYKEAIAAYDRALSSNRTLLNAWYYRGDALAKLGRYGEAALAFSNATSIDPDFVDAYFYESLVYGKLGRYQDQKDALRKGLDAADRVKAAGQAGARQNAESREAVPQPASPGTAFLGAWMACGLWTMVQRRKR